MRKVRIGIDPGKTGAIVIFVENTIEKYMVPLINDCVDVTELNAIISKYATEDIKAVIEDVHAMFNSSAGSTFSFGHTLGLMEGILYANSIPYVKVAPKAWQAEMFQGVQKMMKPPGKPRKNKKGVEVVPKPTVDNKAMALVAAKRLFPSLDLRGTERAKVPHNGIVDALLMAEFCRRKF